MSSIRDRFKGFKDAKPFGKGRNVLPGKYRVEIGNVIVKDSRRPGRKSDCFLIGELRILSFEGCAYVDAKGNAKTSVNLFAPGSSVSHVFNLADENYGLANAKEFFAPIVFEILTANDQLSAVTDDGHPITFEEVFDLLDDDDAASFVETGTFNGHTIKGVVIDMEAWMTVTNAGGDFTAKRFSPAGTLDIAGATT